MKGWNHVIKKLKKTNVPENGYALVTSNAVHARVQCLRCARRVFVVFVFVHARKCFPVCIRVCEFLYVKYHHIAAMTIIDL